MALTSVSFSWRRRSLVVSRTARVMFGREFISIILRNLPSIQPALRDVNRNSGRDPYPKISVKNYMSSEGVAANRLEFHGTGAVGFIRLVRSLCQCGHK